MIIRQLQRLPRIERKGRVEARTLSPEHTIEEDLNLANTVFGLTGQ